MTDVGFGGETIEPERDDGRLLRQLMRTWNAMIDGEWHTPEELEKRTGDRWASISARLRDFRKEKFGASEVDRRYVTKGLYQYRLRPSQSGLIVRGRVLLPAAPPAQVSAPRNFD